MPEDSIDLVVQNHSSDRSFTQGKASDAGLSSKNRKSIRWFFVVAVIFHIIYLTTVFDTYFVTTMSSEIPPVPQKVSAPADRVVIFMADGSKADAVFGFHPDGRPRAPFIREMIQTKGSFGVSHTRVPTETRIGNVAVMGGFSQDPSRITKGWTQNPVDYDHFFNRTTWGWVFASPGVSRLFVSTGNKEQTVDVTRYEPDMVDYSSGPSKLDDWVIGMFDQMLEYVAPTTSSSSNDSSTSTNTSSDAAPRVGPTYEPHFSREELNEKLHSPKIGILLHLLGGDIAGHGHKPYSQVYFDTITHYDQLINDTVAKIDAFYGDSRTAYIFTADHGMLDSGSHGDGGLNNTRVPIVAWGAGISGPIKEKIIGASHDEYSRPWKLEEYVRRDIEQIDLSSLMASLVGVPIPINSEGVIPLDYLNVDDKSKSQFLLTNAQQICSAYEVREDMKKNNEPFFVPYKVSREDVDKAYTQIDEAITAGSYQESQDQAHELIVNCQSGITYLQRYDWILLFSMTILGYVGYIIFGLTTALSNFTNVQDDQIPTQSRITLAKAIYYIFAGLLLTLLFLKHSPARYYGYALFPLYFWFDFLFRTRHLFKREHLTLQNIGQGLIAIVCLEMIVWALHDRRSLSVISIMIGLWPIVAQQKRSLKLTISWVVACLVMAIFPFLPPIGGKDQFLYTLGWMGVMGVIIFGTIYLKEKLSWASILSKAYVLLSFYIANSSDRLLGKSEIPDYYQAFAWSTLVIAALPLFCGLNSKAHFSLRLFTIFSFASPLMIMLSTSYELLFFVCFGVQLTLWIYMERVPQANTQQTLNFSHFKNGIFVLFFVSSAFFGTGNLATISFSLESVFRFMTVFSPFVMGGLLMTRILLPFVLLAVVVIVVCKFSLRLASLSMLIIPMFAIGDVSTMTLFFLVKNSGSWADMGSSLARFIIASAFVMTMLILVGIGNLLMRKSKIEDGAFINLQDVPYAKGLPEDLASEEPSPQV